MSQPVLLGHEIKVDRSGVAHSVGYYVGANAHGVLAVLVGPLPSLQEARETRARLAPPCPHSRLMTVAIKVGRNKGRLPYGKANPTVGLPLPV